jgi:hypothetical protein
MIKLDHRLRSTYNALFSNTPLIPGEEMKIATALLAALFITTAAHAQQEALIVLEESGLQIRTSQQEGVVIFQGTQGQVRTATMGYYYGGGYTPQYMLAMKQIQEELDLSVEQLKKIAEVRAASTKHTQEIYKEMQQVAPEKRSEFYREMTEVHRENMEKAFTEILLSHQKKRLDQIQYQMQLKSQGTYALQNPQLAKTLGITDEQLKEMRQKALDANRKLAEDYQRMRREAQKKILDDVLTKEQKKRLEELSGKSFELKPANRNFRVLDNTATGKKAPEKK